MMSGTRFIVEGKNRGGECRQNKHGHTPIIVEAVNR